MNFDCPKQTIAIAISSNHFIPSLKTTKTIKKHYDSRNISSSVLLLNKKINENNSPCKC